MMPLVEVVKGEKTSELTVKQALKFAAKLGKFPIAVKSRPGFLVNRCLLPYMVEAMYLLKEGVSPVAIDTAAVKFGMPMGPIELADTVGLDVCLSVVKNLTSAFGGEVPQELEEMVKQGNLGKKSGKGYYEYKDGKVMKPEAGSIPPDAVARMIGRMLNENVACLREGLIEDSDLLDGGMIFGTGFAPFRGGPMKYVRDRGIAEVKAELQTLAEKYGDRFKPDAGWDNLK
jgi:3-hydroxyacyl-CoA dehydrogenase/enoyl-CoA hydratase/3-hydroxybutyryl-CoA epimerase